MNKVYDSVVLSRAQPCPHSFQSDMECNVYISQVVYADIVLSTGARSVQQYFMGKGASGFYEFFSTDVMKCDAYIVQQRRVSGSTTMFRGIVERMTKELTVLAPSMIEIKYPCRYVPFLVFDTTRSCHFPCIVISLRDHLVVHVLHVLLLCIDHCWC